MYIYKGFVHMTFDIVISFQQKAVRLIDIVLHRHSKYAAVSNFFRHRMDQSHAFRVRIIFYTHDI